MSCKYTHDTADFHFVRKLLSFHILEKIFLSARDGDVIEAIYEGENSDYETRLYSPLESRFARLNLFATGRYSDLTLVGDDGEIAAHRILLASGSELMRAMLIGSWRESSSPKIRLTELSQSLK